MKTRYFLFYLSSCENIRKLQNDFRPLPPAKTIRISSKQSPRRKIKIPGVNTPRIWFPNIELQQFFSVFVKPSRPQTYFILLHIKSCLTFIRKIQNQILNFISNFPGRTVDDLILQQAKQQKISLPATFTWHSRVHLPTQL